MRRFPVLIAFMLTVVLALPGGAAAKAYPDEIPLPNGFQPEGIVVGAGHDAYTGSLADGSIYKVDLRTGSGEVLVSEPEIAPAVGLDFDERSGYVFVAGGPSGQAAVYDGDTGEAVWSDGLGTGFINDVIVTRDAAYFTNSFLPEFYRVPLAANGRIAGAPETIALSGDFVQGEGFGSNGIEATPDGKTLVIVNSGTGALFAVDPGSGVAAEIDLGGDTVTSGDGIVFSGGTLYVVQNFLNQIAVVELAPDLSSGEVVDTITDPAFRIPTTASAFGSSIYAVNARFDTTPTPDTEYEIVRVDR